MYKLKEIGVYVKSSISSISVLEVSGIIYLLDPYSKNISNRIINSKNYILWILDYCLFN